MSEEINIKSAIDLSQYQKDSILAITVGEGVRDLNIETLKRSLYDLKRKHSMDETVSFLILQEGNTIEALDEKQMNQLGWHKK